MGRFTVVFLNKEGIETAIPVMTFDVIHRTGDIVLAPTRIDGKQKTVIGQWRILRYEWRENTRTCGYCGVETSVYGWHCQHCGGC